MESLQKSLAEANNNNERLQEVLNRANDDHIAELSSLHTQHEKTTTQLKADLEELVKLIQAKRYLQQYFLLFCMCCCVIIKFHTK